MNCSPTIAIALLLLSLTAGTWLLYKTQKENLNTFFKVIAWFVIVVSFCSMICCGMHCMMHCCKSKGECNREQECGMRGEERGYDHCRMGHRGMSERVIIMRGDEEGECEMMGKGCCKEKMECKEGKEECDEMKEGKCADMGKEGKCKMGEKKCDMKNMGMKKDSVVKKK